MQVDISVSRTRTITPIEGFHQAKLLALRLFSRHASAGIGTLHSWKPQDDANYPFIATKSTQQDSGLCCVIVCDYSVLGSQNHWKKRVNTGEDGEEELLCLLKASRIKETNEVLGSWEGSCTAIHYPAISSYSRTPVLVPNDLDCNPQMITNAIKQTGQHPHSS